MRTRIRYAASHSEISPEYVVLFTSVCEAHTWLKYFSENWYMGSMSANCATAKYKTAPRVATVRYFSRAAEMLISVASVSSRRAFIISDVSW